jgi:hypothetical protein
VILTSHSFHQGPSTQGPTRVYINDQKGELIDFTTPSRKKHNRLLSEATWEMPDHLGLGRFSKIKLGNGLWIGLGEARLKSRLREEIWYGAPGVTLISCLQGCLKNRNHCFKNGFELTAGTGALCFSPDPLVERRAGPHEVLQKVILKVPLDQMEMLLENRQLERAVQGDRLFLSSRPLCSGMLATLFQVFNCPFQGSARRLYLEGKATFPSPIHLSSTLPLTISNASKFCVAPKGPSTA